MTRKIFFQILFQLITITSSLQINCRVRDRYLEITQDGFECEILNNLNISSRKSEIDSVKILEVVPNFEEEDFNATKTYEEYFKDYIDGNSSNQKTENTLEFMDEPQDEFSNLQKRNSENFDENLENSTTFELSHLDFPFTALIATKNSINFIPSNISTFFPNLTLLAVINSNLLEIRRHNLQQFPHLKALWLPYNKIKVLEWNLFDFNPQLEQIILIDNQIRSISSDAFAAVINLNHLDLIANECINKVATTREDVEVMMEILSEKCKFECHCEIYYAIAIGIGLIISALAVLCVLKKRN